MPHQLAGGELFGRTNLLGQSPILKLMQLHKSTSATAIPRHSNATSPAASFDEPYEFLFALNCLCPIIKPLLILSLAPCVLALLSAAPPSFLQNLPPLCWFPRRYYFLTLITLIYAGNFGVVKSRHCEESKMLKIKRAGAVC
jgi:hypothetical protein